MPGETDRQSSGCLTAVAIGVLLLIAVASLLVVVWSSEPDKARWTRAQTDMGEIQKALLRYALDHGGKYPASLGDLVPTFGGPLPQDPFTKLDYGYIRTGDGFRLQCLGMDGKPGGTQPPDRDIVFDEKGKRP